MEKSKGKKQIIILGSVLGIFLIFIVVLFLKELLWEPTTQRSPYDEKFVYRDDAIKLNSSDVLDMQDEIVMYMSDEWKKVDTLYFVTIYLNSDLQLNRITFTYQLKDVEEHEGRFEVECNREDDVWEISRAESIYYYDQSPFYDSAYQETADVLLSQKVESIVHYIESKEEPRLELYRVKIDGDTVYIDAKNTENENTQGEWREECVIQEGTIVFVK